MSTTSGSARERLAPPRAAEYLGVSVQTLANWRSSGKTWPLPGGGADAAPITLPYVKLGSRVFYLRSDLDAWLDALTERVGPPGPS